jgi:transcriptional regulator with PAS, ATPase and Fis domain
MRAVHGLIERVARSSLSVLLLGETGAGKEVCAELLHRASPRANGNFVRINCAALPATLLESELFGYEKGAFTGAHTTKRGLLESASGGTLFLDEIADMPREVQAKLLRALESQEILRLGADQPRRVDFRLVTATNEDIGTSVAQGRFRSDLYFRITGVTITIPPLRARPGDIEPLAQAFLARALETDPATRSRYDRPLALSREALEWLRNHRWPGNVRELRNVIERAAILCDGPVIELGHLAVEHRGERRIAEVLEHVTNLKGEVRALERRRIVAALESANGNQHAAARVLGISRGRLRRRLAQYSRSE